MVTDVSGQHIRSILKGQSALFSFLDCLYFEDGTDMLLRNVDKHVPTYVYDSSAYQNAVLQVIYRYVLKLNVEKYIRTAICILFCNPQKQKQKKTFNKTVYFSKV
jgi:hypothetical protein